MGCKGVKNIISLDCQINGHKAIATITNVTYYDKGDTYTFTVENVRNPYSTEQSDVFTDVSYSTSDLYPVAKAAQPATGVHASVPHPLIIYNSTQNNLEYESVTELLISFQTVNALPKDGAVEIVYPS